MTISTDTNLLVRLATKDDEAAHEAVTSIFDEEEIFVAKTVLLETEWVLRSRYQYAKKQTLAFFQHLLSVPNIIFEDENAVLEALERVAQGWDFADALHVASSGKHSFLTMDRALARKAARQPENTVRLLLR